MKRPLPSVILSINFDFGRSWIDGPSDSIVGRYINAVFFRWLLERVTCRLSNLILMASATEAPKEIGKFSYRDGEPVSVAGERGGRDKRKNAPSWVRIEISSMYGWRQIMGEWVNG